MNSNELKQQFVWVSLVVNTWLRGWLVHTLPHIGKHMQKAKLHVHKFVMNSRLGDVWLTDIWTTSYSMVVECTLSKLVTTAV